MDRLIHWLQLPLLLLFLLALSPSCKKDKSSPPENPLPPKISTGATTLVAAQNIGSGGSTITVNVSGNPLNGMEISIPAGSFPSGNNIVVKSVEITGHQFGEAFHPVTPLIRIETDNEYSEQILSFKIPVTQVTNGVYGAYFYDESSQTLEAIPCFERTGGTVELNLQHFQSNTILNKAGSGKINVNIIVSSVTESFLDGKPMLTTGYEPGTDDWEFKNMGSYITTGGNCAGQSLSSIYYYYEQKLRKNAPPLYNRFDQIHTNTVWEDNPQGYRLASATQQCVGADWATRVWPMVNELIGKPYTTFKLFKHAFRTTALPQLVYIRNAAKGYAHAMVAYKLDLNSDRIYVADPNKPGDKTLYIQYNRATQTWTPYNGATRADDTTFTFEQISFLGVSAMIPWHTIRGYYLDFEAGNGGSRKFPTYELKTKAGTTITDGMKVTDGTFEFYARSVGCAGALSGTDHYQIVDFHQKPYATLFGGGGAGNAGIGTLYLDPGINKIGFVIKGIDAAGKVGYLDFKWINIDYSTSGTPTVNITSMASNFFKYGYYKFKASLSGASLPANRKYEWRVMDVSDPPRTTVIQNDTAWLLLKKTGTYKITCYLMEMPSGNIVAYGEKEITVNDPITDYEKLGISHSTYVELYGDFRYQEIPLIKTTDHIKPTTIITCTATTRNVFFGMDLPSFLPSVTRSILLPETMIQDM